MHIIKTRARVNNNASVEVPTGEEIDVLTNVAHRLNTSGGESSYYLTFRHFFGYFSTSTSSI